MTLNSSILITLNFIFLMFLCTVYLFLQKMYAAHLSWSLLKYFCGKCWHFMTCFLALDPGFWILDGRWIAGGPRCQWSDITGIFSKTEFHSVKFFFPLQQKTLVLFNRAPYYWACQILSADPFLWIRRALIPLLCWIMALLAYRAAEKPIINELKPELHGLKSLLPHSFAHFLLSFYPPGLFSVCAEWNAIAN